MRITKFKIEPINPQTGERHSEDETFVLTKETRMTVTTRFMQETDENGNLISDRHPYPPSAPENTVEESMIAVGMQSKEPATVIILETDQGPTKAGIAQYQADNSRMRSVRIDHLMRSDVRKINPDSLF